MTNSIPLARLESSPGAKFTTFGDTYRGRIVALEERQQTDMDNNPRTFKDGTPMMQWVISIEQADGEVVALYARNGNYHPDSGTGEAMLAAIGTAVRAAGAEAVDVGGELAVAYTGTEALSGGKTAKCYTAAYKPPAPAATSIPAADLFGGS
jgi:hypothetical protein